MEFSVNRITRGFVILVVLSGCASSSGVFRVDDNKYQITTRATWELGGRAGWLAQSVWHLKKQPAIVNLKRKWCESFDLPKITDTLKAAPLI